MFFIVYTSIDVSILLFSVETAKKIDKLMKIGLNFGDMD